MKRQNCCLRKTACLHDALQRAGSFAINIPGEKKSSICFRIVRKQINKEKVEMCLSHVPWSWSPSSREQSCLCSPSMVLSDCSLSFCLPATRMRRYNKSFLTPGLWCHSFFFLLFNLSYFIILREEETVAAAQVEEPVCTHPLPKLSFSIVPDECFPLNEDLRGKPR